MTDSFVQVSPDSTGKKINTQQLTDSDGNIVHRQVAAIGDAVEESRMLTITADGAARVEAETLPLPSGASTEATLAAVAAALQAVQALLSGTLDVSTGLAQPVTNAELRAAAVPVSGTFYPATQPVSATALPLPTGAAAETTLSALNTKTPALGQAAMAASRPVVIASNQSAVPVSAASLPLPSGAATAAKQDTIISALGGTLAANEKYGFAAISATSTVKSGAGTLGGILVSSVTAGATVTIYDNTAASGTVILAAMEVTAGTPYPLPVAFATGCHVVITGTASITVFYN